MAMTFAVTEDRFKVRLYEPFTSHQIQNHFSCNIFNLSGIRLYQSYNCNNNEIKFKIMAHKVKCLNVVIPCSYSQYYFM